MGGPPCRTQVAYPSHTSSGGSEVHEGTPRKARGARRGPTESQRCVTGPMEGQRCIRGPHSGSEVYEGTPQPLSALQEGRRLGDKKRGRLQTLGMPREDRPCPHYGAMGSATTQTNSSPLTPPEGHTSVHTGCCLQSCEAVNCAILSH